MTTEKFFAVTICATRRQDMPEDEYHQYLRQHHVPLLRDLKGKEKIVSFSLQHNTSEVMDKLRNTIDDFPPVRPAYDCIIQMVFKSFKDFLEIRQEEHFRDVVMKDMLNFADLEESKLTWGVWERVSMGGEDDIVAHETEKEKS